MSLPQFELPDPVSPAPRPSRGGWIALCIVLGTLIALQLVSYLGRDSEESDPFVAVSASFRQAILVREALERIPGSARFLGTEFDDATIDELIAQVAPERKKHATAARLYAAMRNEVKKEVKPEDLEILAKSLKPEERSFAELYSQKSLTPEQVEELTVDFPDAAFSYRIAHLHALEKSGDKGARKRFFPDADVMKLIVGFGLMMGAILTGTLLLFLYGAMRLSGRWKPAGHPEGAATPAIADAYAGKAALMLMGFILCGVGISIVFAPVLREEFVNVLAGVATTTVALLLLTKWRGKSGPTLKLFAFEKKQFWGDVVWGVGGAMANIPLFLCVGTFGRQLFSGLPAPEHPINTQLQADQSLVTVILLGIAAAVIAPIFEEICFRGAITPAMERLFGGPAPGIIAAGLAFAAIHPTGIPAWFPLAMIGSMAAMLTYQRGSLMAAVVFHAVHNASLLMLTLLIF